MSSKEYQAAWHQANKERRLISIKAAKKIRQDRFAFWLRYLKENNPCTDCNSIYPYYVMQFDHVRGTKTGNISVAIRNDWSYGKITAELDKCELVCSNCHAERTHQRRTKPD